MNKKQVPLALFAMAFAYFIGYFSWGIVTQQPGFDSLVVVSLILTNFGGFVAMVIVYRYFGDNKVRTNG